MKSNVKKADKELIKAHLCDELKELKIITVAEASSTNDELKRIALTEKENDVLYIAERQTKGKGRMGRSFFSPEGTGIYMSLLLHPSLKTEDCTLLTPLCAVALSQAIERVTGIKTAIKWVNDIFAGNKKVAGILTEASFTKDSTDYVIVGMGINLAVPQEGFPEEIESIAGALTKNKTDFKNELIAEILNCFMLHYKKIAERSFVGIYKSKLFFLGSEITVISPSGSYSATAIDIDEMCRLKVRLRDGSEKTLCGGEISVKIQ